MQTLVVLISAFAAVVALVPVTNAVAFRVGAIATPRADRWNHRAVPMLGGVAIFGGALLGVFLLPLGVIDRAGLVVGLGVMFALGVADDFRRISAPRRLAIEAITGAGFVWLVSEGLTTELRVAAVILGAVAIPVAVNATNLTDNADGLAATLAIATGGTLAAASALTGLNSSNSSVALLVTAAAAGFLAFNRPPARVFMGDCGSLTLGFGLAAASVLLVRDALLIPGSTHVAAAVAVPVAWAFQVGDLGMVMVTRMHRGASPFEGGVDHTSHRLLAAGITPWSLLLSLGTLAGLVGGIAAAAAAFFGGFALTAVVAVGLLLLVGIFEAAVARRLPATAVVAHDGLRGDQDDLPAVMSPLPVER